MGVVGGVSGGDDSSYSTHWCGGDTPRTVHTGVVGTLLVQYTLVWWGHSSYSTHWCGGDTPLTVHFVNILFYIL